MPEIKMERRSRRDFLHLTGAGIAGATLSSASGLALPTQSGPADRGPVGPVFDVKSFGAKGDGAAVDTPAVNRAIEGVAAAGGGMLRFPAGTYKCFTIRRKSKVNLYLDMGETIVAADTGSEGQYDAAEPNQWDKFQDYGHNHWHNSLIQGEGIENFGVQGPGLIWGKGLSRGSGRDTPRAEDPGVGNKAIALKNCHNVILRDFSILHGGHFGILATGVDNF